MSDKKQRKYSSSDIVTFIIYAIMAIFAVVLIEEVIRCFIIKNESIFIKNYIKTMIYLIITAFIYFISYYLQEKNRLFAKEWLKIAVNIYFFITLVICNIFNLYTYRVVRYIIFAINGVFFAIFGVSIYYNYLKNENNKESTSFLV